MGTQGSRSEAPGPKGHSLGVWVGPGRPERLHAPGGADILIRGRDGLMRRVVSSERDEKTQGNSKPGASGRVLVGAPGLPLLDSATGAPLRASLRGISKLSSPRDQGLRPPDLPTKDRPLARNSDDSDETQPEFFSN